MDGDGEDDMWLVQALAVLLQAGQGLGAGCRPLIPVQRLLDSGSKRFFDRIYSSTNPFLFREHCRMDKALYDILFDACEDYIPRKIKYRREVVAVTLDWLGRAATCRDQETKFEMALSTVHRYRRVGLYAILRGLAGIIGFPSSVPTEFVQKFPYFDQDVGAIDGVHVPVMVSVEDAERFRNRKGWTSTNVLIVSAGN
ncbi:hypothetical protein PHYPSEUDO_015535 [Phytophthora pseudosyringae]|uniref:DDE Tnp4 domain-containing protein n=1 Tax=Phytophthora pseudosyringae TaxID=221518 RepID=A0A8T1VZ55_9STRA|nr:hypothetical protein PHYPSEUDO_015535 [Phytophthora pseudosyringae]